MSDSKHYMHYTDFGKGPEIKEYWRINKKYNIEVSPNFDYKPYIYASVARFTPTDDKIPTSFDCMKYKRISEAEFTEYFNKNYAAFQNLRLRGGEYYVCGSHENNSFSFDAFFEKPRLHCSVECRKSIEGSDVSLFCQHTISQRPSVKKKSRHVSEDVFLQVFKMVLEFLYDGSAMPVLQDKLIEAVKGMIDPENPVMEEVINQESYYQKARNLMLQRKEEIRSRLLELDDKPSKRRELRAQMKAIDYCVSVLDNNH